MQRFMFWNLRNNPRVGSTLAQAVRTLHLDTLIFCECDIPEPQLLADIALSGARFQGPHFYAKEKIAIFSRHDPSYFTHHLHDDRFDIFEVALPGMPTFLLMAVHLQSKATGWDENDLFAEALTCASLLREQEEKRKLYRTIVVGDFNMNPYSAGMTAAQGFHGLMDPRDVAKTKRRVSGRDYRMFYNPMWNHFGDKNEPHGTHYHGPSKPVRFGWNILDQVLISAEMLPAVPRDSVRIVTEIGKTKLRTREGRPSKQHSDHFPLYFEVHSV